MIENNFFITVKVVSTFTSLRETHPGGAKRNPADTLLRTYHAA
jgi:hypothetical protein